MIPTAPSQRPPPPRTSPLNAQRVRQLSPRSLRAYARDLPPFARWRKAAPFPEITESTLLNYVRPQLDQEPKPSPRTVNHRLGVVHGLHRFHCGREIPSGQSHFQRTYTRRSPLGYGRPRRAMALGLRLRQPRRVVAPLSADEVAAFWRSFRTFRDLALVGLMLLDGLRSCEVLALHLEDLQLAGSQIRVLGKGNRKRVLPLPPEMVEVLEKYPRLERYVQVTQQDLQREFHTARQRAAQPHHPPVLSVPNCPTSADLPGLHQALAATRHLLEMYRRGLPDEKTRRRLQPLDRRLLDVALQLDRITKAEE